jgi:hypothetical protein
MSTNFLVDANQVLTPHASQIDLAPFEEISVDLVRGVVCDTPALECHHPIAARKRSMQGDGGKLNVVRAVRSACASPGGFINPRNIRQ